MRFILFLGCGFMLVVAGDEETTATQSNMTTEGISPTVHSTTQPDAEDISTSTITTSMRATERSSTSTSPRTTSSETVSSSNIQEDSSISIMSSPGTEAESSERHEVSSTVSLTTDAALTSVPTREVSTLPSPNSSPSPETTSAPHSSPDTTSQPPTTTTTSTVPSSSGDGAMDSSSSTTTTTTTAITLPPVTTAHTSAEPERSTSVQVTTVTTTDNPTTESTVNTTDTLDSNTTTTTTTTNTTTTTTTTDNSTDETTSEAPIITVTPAASSYHFGKTEVNTLVVVAVVVAVNVMSVVLTALCVHRLVSRRLSWDPPPLYRHRSTRSEKGQKVMRGTAGRNLASDKECRAGEGEGQASTQIPILITNEDGWCVPYSSETQEGKKKREKDNSSSTKDTGV